jgi:hypothetical protein
MRRSLLGGLLLSSKRPPLTGVRLPGSGLASGRVIVSGGWGAGAVEAAAHGVPETIESAAGIAEAIELAEPGIVEAIESAAPGIAEAIEPGLPSSGKPGAAKLRV